MGIYPKISNGIVALRVRDGKLGELCTAHCSNSHVEDNLQWFLKRDPNNHPTHVYMSNKGEATWDIPISSLPTVEEKEFWNRHPTFCQDHKLTWPHMAQVKRAFSVRGHEHIQN